MVGSGMGLSNIDIVIIILYMAGVFFLGLHFRKYVKNAGDFFIAGKALPFWAIGMSIVVSDIGAMDFVANAGGAYTDGIAIANFDWIGSMPAMVFAAFIFVPYFWRAGVYTIPEFLGKRYNQGVQLVHAAIWGIFLLTMLSLMLWVTGDQLSNTILGWNPYFVIVLMAIITGVYTFSGGLSAVVMVDVVQLIMMFVGGIALLVLSLWEVGGPAGLQEKVLAMSPRMIVTVGDHTPDTEAGEVEEDAVQAALTGAGYTIENLYRVYPSTATEETRSNRFFVRMETIDIEVNHAETPADIRRNARKHVDGILTPLVKTGKMEINELVTYEGHFSMLLPHDTDKPYPWTGILFGLGIVLAIAYMSGNQAVVQRTLGARTEWDAKGGMLFGGFLKAFIPLMVSVPGLCALVVAPDLADGERAVPHMIAVLLPPGLRGLMFVALFAALMSSVDSTLNSATTIWTNDLYGRFYRWFKGHELDEKKGLWVGRIMTVIFIVGAAVMAPQIAKAERLYVFIQTLLSLFQGPTLAILIVGILWKRATGWGGFAGLVLGVIFTSYLNFYGQGWFHSGDPFLFIAWWSFVFSIVVTIVVSLLTKPEPEEKIRGLVWGQVMKDGEIQRILTERVKS
jgi:Na+/proline symporter